MCISFGDDACGDGDIGDYWQPAVGNCRSDLVLVADRLLGGRSFDKRRIRSTKSPATRTLGIAAVSNVASGTNVILLVCCRAMIKIASGRIIFATDSLKRAAIRC